jgi:protein-L-isoaspartate(D-aspartate) O-methyltransferase
MSAVPGKARRRFPASLASVAPGASAAQPAPRLPLRPAQAPPLKPLVLPASMQGLDAYAAVRHRMVSRLHAQGVSSEPVLHALARVARHRFVDTALATQAYEDTSLPIGHGQTISKPSVVARMLEWLFLGELARQRGHLGHVLEIGTGCGYQAAVLRLLGRSVVSVERVAPLFEAAGHRLRQLSPAGQRAQSGPPALAEPAPCRLLFGDGMLGAPQHAPFDSIVAAASGEALPTAWLEQLAVGGRLVAPARAPGGAGQVLLIVDRTEEGWQTTIGEAVQFVPLKSGTA